MWSFEDFEVGQEFETVFELTEERVATFLRILGYRDRLLSDLDTAQQAGLRATPVPPMFAAAYQHIAAVPRMTLPPGGIYLKQELTFQGVCYPGDRLTTVTTIESKYEKKGRNYIRTDSQTVNQLDEPIAWGRRVRIW
jgi:acyl dehydratase